MNWRAWIYDQLTTDGAITAIVPAGRIRSSGASTGRLDVKPFINIRLMDTAQEVGGDDETRVVRQPVQIYVHDDPGSYKRIEELLELIRIRLEGQVAVAGAVACRWVGHSGDLFDEGYGTIVKYAMFRCFGTQ